MKKEESILNRVFLTDGDGKKIPIVPVSPDELKFELRNLKYPFDYVQLDITLNSDNDKSLNDIYTKLNNETIISKIPGEFSNIYKIYSGYYKIIGKEITIDMGNIEEFDE